jgi:serine/threonine protein kinase
MAAFQPDQPTDFVPGYQFLQYQLLEQIGYGGQGFVWSAVDRTNDRIVAIKFTRIDGPDQKLESEAQFKHQAGQLMQLSHPNTLPLFDFGSSPPYRYLVSPFLSGGSLQERIFSGTLSIQNTLDFSARIASVLDYLHSKGIIHRDLKPSNILLDSRNHPYVADFGLARNIVDTTQAMHTGHGTPPYAPPEQHTLRALTLKSDIFEFGVMLFEMFTRQLPWEGKKSLGLQQLYTEDEIPDPREINPGLPPGVWNVLRTMTSADPDMRYGSAMQAVSELFAEFNLNLPSQILKDAFPYQPAQDAGFLLQQYMKGWTPEAGASCLNLTHFSVIDSEQRKTLNTPQGRPDISAFMLQHAIAHGYNDDFWWVKVTDPADRLRLSLLLASGENRMINERVVRHIVQDEQIRTLKKPLTESAATVFLEVARSSRDPALRRGIFNTLFDFAPASNHWRPAALGPQADRLLAALALEPPPEGDIAAALIGTLRSTYAVETILKSEAGKRRNDALLAVQQSAGSLPPSIPDRIRLESTGRWFTRRLFDQPLRILSVYGWIVLGIALSVGLQTYLTYRLPQFMDTLRILGSLERGAILGLILGIGILTTRIIVERLPEINGILGLGAALIFGAILINLAFFIFDVLMNSLVPAGILVTTGSLLIAAGYGLGGLVKTRLVKILITSVFVGVAIAGSWVGHVLLSRVNIAMSPIFFYEYSWSPAQIFATILVVAIPMSVFGNFGNLSPSSQLK